MLAGMGGAMARQSRAEVVLVPWRFCHNTQLPPPPELSIPRQRAKAEAEPEGWRGHHSAAGGGKAVPHLLHQQRQNMSLRGA